MTAYCSLLTGSTVPGSHGPTVHGLPKASLRSHGPTVLQKAFIVSLALHLGVVTLFPARERPSRPKGSGEEDVVIDVSFRPEKEAEPETALETTTEEAAEPLELLAAVKAVPLEGPEAIPLAQTTWHALGLGYGAGPRTRALKVSVSSGSSASAGSPRLPPGKEPFLLAVGSQGTAKAGKADYVSAKPVSFECFRSAGMSAGDHSKGTDSETSSEELSGSPAAPKASNPPPEYPFQARRRGWEGEVVLKVIVLASGLVQDVEIRASSGYPALDRAALSTVRAWQFIPAFRDGRAIDSIAFLPVVFRLQ